MDIQQFNQIYNQNDDSIPNFDLGMDQVMSSLNEKEWKTTDGREIIENISDLNNDVSHPLPNNSLAYALSRFYGKSKSRVHYIQTR